MGAIGVSSHEEGEFISNIFFREKPNGQIRIILNLKSLNHFIDYKHFKMEHLNFITDMVRNLDWFGSIDLTDAYFSVSVHEEHWKFLKFKWNGTLFHYRVLVFGLSSAPRVFTKLCKPVLAILRGTHLIRCSLYLDDLLLMNGSESNLNRDLNLAKSLLTNLGFSINIKKSILTPTQNIRHLGFMIDSTSMCLSIPPDKIELLEDRCRRTINSGHCISIREVASVIGVLIANCVASKWGQLFYRNLERDKIQNLKSNRGNFDSFMKLSVKAISDLNFWLSTEKQIPSFFGHTPVALTITSDASGVGWGAHCNEQRTGGKWLNFESKNHINWLELKASWLALQCFAKQLTNKHISLKLDNSCAIYYLNNKGGVVEHLDHLAKDIWLWCKSRNLSIHASHIPGKENVIADFESRNFKESTEWSLSRNCFTLITSHFGVPDIDLFASRLNYKVTPYISWFPDPKCSGVDAFSLNWDQFKLAFVFPPFNLVGKVVAKTIQEKAEILLVAPLWNTQYWYPMIMSCTLGEPFKLPCCPDTITLSHDESVKHPIWAKLNLYCFRLSGKR